MAMKGQLHTSQILRIRVSQLDTIYCPVQNTFFGGAQIKEVENLKSFNCSPLVLFLCLFLSLADCSPPVLFLCFSLSLSLLFVDCSPSVSFLRFLLSLAMSIHWFARFCSKVTPHNAPPHNAFFIPVLGRPIWDEMRGQQIALPTTLTLPFFSVLLVFYTQDTFEPFLNFKVGHFAHHFLFLSFSVAMKGIQFTQLRCHISSLVHSVHHLFYFIRQSTIAEFR